MTKFKGEVWFLASCIEIYKDEKGLSGAAAFNYLQKNAVIPYIVNGWDGLHMTGPRYIVDAIDEYIKNNPAAS